MAWACSGGAASLQDTQPPVGQPRPLGPPLDVVALDAAGRAVLDLTPADLVVTVDGQPRPVRSLRYVFRGTGAGEAAGSARTAVPAVADPARLVVLAIDENTVRRGREKAVTSAAWRVIDSLTPGDLIGVMALPRPHGQVALLADREPLRVALSALIGRAVDQQPLVEASSRPSFPSDTPGPDNPLSTGRTEGQPQASPEPRPDPAATMADPSALQAGTGAGSGLSMAGTGAPPRDLPDTGEDSLRTLRQLIDELRGVPGQKFVVYFTGGDAEGEPRAARWMPIDPRELVDIAALARVSVHVVRVQDGDRRPSDPGLDRLAKDTGGTVSTVRAKRADLGSLIATLASGYLIEVDVDESARRDRAVPIGVRAARKGVTLVAASRWAPRDDPFPAPVAPAPAAVPAAAAAASEAPGRPRREADRTPAHDGELDAVLARVARYVDTYLAELGNVVAEESYQQVLRTGTRVISARRTKSDLLLLRSKDDWIAFRDVFEVDGRPVRDREDRLHKLFLENPAEALNQGRRISEESARYNLGDMYRTINTPVLALSFFQSAFLPTFTFERHGTATVDGTVLWRIDYKEVGSPTQIAHAVTGEDRPSTGSIFVEPSSGRIVRTVLKNGDAGMLVEMSVRYRPNDTMGLWMPAQMEERYFAPGTRRESISTEASYSGFRRFQVATAEGIVPPK
jgi:hypothetical protein